jgi:hypothetical protein
MMAWGLTSCEDDPAPALNEANKITSFKIGEALGAIDEITQTITVYIPRGETKEPQALSPEVTVSSKASLYPSSGEELNFSHPTSYTVTAENGVSRTYTVTVIVEEAPVVLESIAIRALPTRTAYETGDSFDPSGLVVVGLYSDGSVREEPGYTLSPSPVPTNAIGPVVVTVSVPGLEAPEVPVTFTVTVGAQRDVSVTIGLPNTNEEPEIFGIPEGGIILSASKNGHPDTIVISAAGKYDYSPPAAVYSSVQWYVDGTSLSSGSTDNIITIKASDYTLKIPHYITFVGTKGPSSDNRVEYSRTIPFTVER